MFAGKIRKKRFLEVYERPNKASNGPLHRSADNLVGGAPELSETQRGELFWSARRSLAELNQTSTKAKLLTLR